MGSDRPPRSAGTPTPRPTTSAGFRSRPVGTAAAPGSAIPHPRSIMASHLRGPGAEGRPGDRVLADTFVLDTIAPEAEIESGPSGRTEDRTPTFRLEMRRSGEGRVTRQLSVQGRQRPVQVLPLAQDPPEAVIRQSHLRAEGHGRCRQSRPQRRPQRIQGRALRVQRPTRIRTWGLLLRRESLYPAELSGLALGHARLAMVPIGEAARGTNEAHSASPLRSFPPSLALVSAD